jgi:hypothetical protein
MKHQSHLASFCAARLTIRPQLVCTHPTMHVLRTTRILAM